MNTLDRRKQFNVCVSIFFFVAVIRYSNKSNPREERFVSVHSSVHMAHRGGETKAAGA